MGIQVKVDDKKLRKALLALAPEARKKILKTATNKLLRMQAVRLEQGIGSNGEPLKYKGRIYSPQYAEKRQESGRSVERRNLTWSGAMGRARKILKASGDGVQAGWSPGPEAEKAAHNERMTPFIAPTKEERAAVIELIRKMVKASIKSGKAETR